MKFTTSSIQTENKVYYLRFYNCFIDATNSPELKLRYHAKYYLSYFQLEIFLLTYT